MDENYDIMSMKTLLFVLFEPQMQHMKICTLNFLALLDQDTIEKIAHVIKINILRYFEH